MKLSYIPFLIILLVAGPASADVAYNGIIVTVESKVVTDDDSTSYSLDTTAVRGEIIRYRVTWVPTAQSRFGFANLDIKTNPAGTTVDTTTGGDISNEFIYDWDTSDTAVCPYEETPDPAQGKYVGEAYLSDGGDATTQPESPAECRVALLVVALQSTDANFAPSVENLDVSYDVWPSGYAAGYAKIEVFKNGDETNPVYRDDTTIAGLNSQTVYWDGIANQGTHSGEYMGPENSPYTVRVSISSTSDFSATWSDDSETAVEVSSITLSPAGPAKMIVNEPIMDKQEVSALVKLKKKDGSGAITAVPIWVDFSFEDPDDNNTLKDDSFNYNPTAGFYLGTKGWDAWTYWADHTYSESQSDDGFKLACRGKTVVEDGENKGKAFVWFRPSGVGGDDYKLKALVKKSDEHETVCMAQETDKLTVWRQIIFGSIYEMVDTNHVMANATEAQIQVRYFNAAYVDYVAPATSTRLAANLSVKYIGLWESEGDNQQDWAVIQQPKAGVNHTITYGPYADPENPVIVATEIPTQAELDWASLPATDPRHGGAEYLLARKIITQKAQAWVERIDAAFRAASCAWQTETGIDHGIIGIRYYHPKYSLAGGDTATNKWPDWVRVTTDRGANENKDPDGIWTSNTGGIAGQSTTGMVFVTIAQGWPAESVRGTIAHEVGHATATSFWRQPFGPVKDHSVDNGLMDPGGSAVAFTPRERKILRGIKQP